MIQADMFDLKESRRRRDEGLLQVASNNAEFLESARACAKEVARTKPNMEITMDDVRRACIFQPLHHNAWGAVFRLDCWANTGKRRTSELVQGHGNSQIVWRLIEE